MPYLLLLTMTPAQAMDVDQIRFDTLIEATALTLSEQVTTLSAAVQARVSSAKPLILDFAQDFVFWADAAAKATAYGRRAAHIMASEDSGGSRGNYLSRNPAFKTWTYGLDLTRIQSKGDPAENKVLHGVNGSRLPSTVWSSAHWVYNLRDPTVQDWNVARLVALCGENDELFLDEHTSNGQMCSARRPSSKNTICPVMRWMLPTIVMSSPF